MLTRYRRGAHVVDALLFDGTAEAASEISRLFGSFVEGHPGCIEVSTAFGRVYAGAGCWVVRDRAMRVLSVVDDRDFIAQYEPAEDTGTASHALRTEQPGMWHHGGPASDRWDVI